MKWKKTKRRIKDTILVIIIIYGLVRVFTDDQNQSQAIVLSEKEKYELNDCSKITTPTEDWTRFFDSNTRKNIRDTKIKLK